MEKRLIAIQLVAVANRAADDAALHVAPAIAARHHTVAYQERSGANVVGNHAQ